MDIAHDHGFFEAAMLYDRHDLQNRNFVELLEQFRSLHATDPQDKGFAFTGPPSIYQTRETFAARL